MPAQRPPLPLRVPLLSQIADKNYRRLAVRPLRQREARGASASPLPPPPARAEKGHRRDLGTPRSQIAKSSPQCTLLPVSSLSAASAAPRSGRRLAPSQCGPSAASRQHFQPPPPLSARGGALGSQPPSPSCSSVGDGSAVCGMSARAEAGLMPFECSAPIASTISPLIPMRADHFGRRWS